MTYRDALIRKQEIIDSKKCKIGYTLVIAPSFKEDFKKYIREYLRNDGKIDDKRAIVLSSDMNFQVVGLKEADGTLLRQDF